MRTTLAIISLFISALLAAQAPALIPYQAIARNAAGEPLASSTLNARFTIHDGTATGNSVWQELQTVSTSALGLFTAQLGSSVSLSTVNWSNGAKFMQVEIDFGSGFVDIGTQQLLSVPYALYSASSEIASNGFSNVSFTGDTLYLANGTFLIIPGISAANNGGGSGIGAHICGTPNIHNPNLTYSTMTDQEGNVYKTIVIGTQEWMAENLNTSIYRNGDAISTNLDNAAWASTTSGAWAYYNNDAGYACPYGKLYNWYTCVDARQLCPTGWHVPTDAEWTVLTDYLGGEAVAAGKMKTTGTIEAATGLWYSPNTEATNSSGFSGAPGGVRYSNGAYYYIGDNGNWWSSSEVGTNAAWYRYLYYDDGNAGRSDCYKRNGFSVRCLRD
ncbi:MAG: fibrobacter succinogenes major paralogous domain-containing protein [Flavobacteriales bacterium]|jgi:uncharacterized protein (TIGR02145 family)